MRKLTFTLFIYLLSQSFPRCWLHMSGNSQADKHMMNGFSFEIMIKWDQSEGTEGGNGRLLEMVCTIVLRIITCLKPLHLKFTKWEPSWRKYQPQKNKERVAEMQFDTTRNLTFSFSGPSRSKIKGESQKWNNELGLVLGKVPAEIWKWFS